MDINSFSNLKLEGSRIKRLDEFTGREKDSDYYCTDAGEFISVKSSPKVLTIQAQDYMKTPKVFINGTSVNVRDCVGWLFVNRKKIRIQLNLSILLQLTAIGKRYVLLT